MTKLFKPLTLLLSFLIFSTLAFSQTGEIKIKFIGNCGMYLTDGQSNIYVDFPYKSGAYGYNQYRASELDSIKDNSMFIFTHKHADHYSKKIVRKIKGSGKVFTPWNSRKLQKSKNALPDFSIKVIKTKHRFTFKHNSYVITWHGKKIFLSGDTEYAETAVSVKNIDCAFVPYWIILDANDKNLKIDTKKLVIYHIYQNQKFGDEMPKEAIFFNKQYEVMTIPY